MARGNQGRDIYADERDRKLWLATLGEACEKTGWRIHAWVMMNNHYHLLLETPEANLVAGMKWLQGTYTQRYNSRHEQVSVPTIDTFGCARFHPFGNGKPQKRVGPTKSRSWGAHYWNFWMRQISPVWQRETPKAGRPCHPGAAEAVETPGATLSRVRDTPRTGVPGPNSPAEPTKGSSQSTPPGFSSPHPILIGGETLF